MRGFMYTAADHHWLRVHRPADFTALDAWLRDVLRDDFDATAEVVLGEGEVRAMVIRLTNGKPVRDPDKPDCLAMVSVVRPAPTPPPVWCPGISRRAS